ncbi:MAG: chlorophyll a-b binding domain-containing protein [Pseudanabaenales cyanobacterium]|nr:chlorophyll a-b binding domain-containing protein [Pseudanabaenales cyanobacterium]
MTEIKPTVLPKLERPKTGFNAYAERLNGRVAMIGFIAIVVIEYVTGRSILTWLGWG